MVRFLNDYSEGAHPEVLQSIIDSNLNSTDCYGADEYCLRAEELILQACGAPQGKVYFISGGTQTNLTYIAAALKPYQGVISTDEAHIFVHESGAIEATGHRVIATPAVDGKVTPAAVQRVCQAALADPQSILPGMVYISSPSETGSVYSLDEVKALREMCDRYGLLLYLDGARLGFGLMGPNNSLTLKDIAALCDAFYIGGTKLGALVGEALVITNPDQQVCFRYVMKQRGSVLAKARVMGVQFEAFFRDGLYYRIAAEAVDKAQRLKAVFEECGIPMLGSNDANMLFPQMSDDMLAYLQQHFMVERRIVISWATREEDVQALMAAVRAYGKEHA